MENSHKQAQKDREKLLDPKKVYDFHRETFTVFLEKIHEAYMAEEDDELRDVSHGLYCWIGAVVDEKEALMR